MIRSQKPKSHLSFCLRDHVRSSDKQKTLYLDFCEDMLVKPEMVMAYEKGSPSTMVE